MSFQSLAHSLQRHGRQCALLLLLWDMAVLVVVMVGCCGGDQVVVARKGPFGYHPKHLGRSMLHTHCHIR